MSILVMSLKTCSFDMDVPRGVSPGRPLAEGAPAVFEHLLEVFAPRALWVQLDGHDVVELRRTDDTGPGQSRWSSEELRPGDPLTRCPPGPAADLVRELQATLAARHPTSLFIGANGALRHRAPGTMAADWYGHWRLDTGVLLDLVEILRAFADFGRSLSSDDVSARYRRIEDEIRGVIAWIEAQRDEIAAERIPADTLGALRDKTAPAIDAAARAWPDEVHAYSSRYPCSGSEAHRS